MATDKPTPHPFAKAMAERDHARLLAKQQSLRIYYYRGAPQWELWPIGEPVRRDNTRRRKFSGTFKDCLMWLRAHALEGELR